jgi:hypothetical protein
MSDAGDLDELASLAEQAEAVDTGRRGVPPPAAPDESAVASAEAGELVEFVGLLALPLLPVLLPRIGEQLAAAYGPEQRQAIAQALAALAVKRGWSIGDAVGRYGPELALAAALAGPALPIVLADAKARKAPRAPAAPAPATEIEHRAGELQADPNPAPGAIREYATADDGRIK